MLIDNISTIVVEPGCTAHITVNQDVRIELGQQQAAAAASEGAAGAAPAAAAADTECDPIQLAIFSHRWDSLACPPAGPAAPAALWV